MITRLDYRQSCARLRELGLLGADDDAPLPSQMPSYADEEPLGVNSFRTGLADIDLSNLTLPRTFAARSLFERVSFVGSDLSESRLCWNDFNDCVFASTNLSRADLRASLFDQVVFDEADLTGADLRQSNFTGCHFTGARLRGAKLTREQGVAMQLSAAQRSEVAWTDDPGPEPDG
jgi:BTB/POZ domain-containing protein KCTD9